MFLSTARYKAQDYVRRYPHLRRRQICKAVVQAYVAIEDRRQFNREYLRLQELINQLCLVRSAAQKSNVCDMTQAICHDPLQHFAENTIVDAINKLHRRAEECLGDFEQEIKWRLKAINDKNVHKMARYGRLALC